MESAKLAANGSATQFNSSIPALPDEIQSQLYRGQGTGEWLDTYVEYSSKVSPMTPISFHRSAGLALISIAVARRVKVSTSFDDIYPNLYIVWLAQPSIYRKTTAMNIPTSIALELCPHLIGANESTPEALLSDMAGVAPTNFQTMSELEQEQWKISRNFAAQKGLILDEFSGFLENASKKYNAGMTETIMKLYDCAPRFQRNTRGQGLLTVNKAYLTILGASTPGGMQDFLSGQTLWHNGFWSRFALLTPETPPTWKTACRVEQPPAIKEQLQRLYEALPYSTQGQPAEAMAVTLAPDAEQIWEQYSKAMSFDLVQTPTIDERLIATYSRFPIQVLKVATLLCAIEWAGEGEMRLETRHICRAITIVEEWRASTHRLISEKIVGDTLDKHFQRVLSKIEEAGEAGITSRDISKNTGLKSDAVNDALTYGIDLGQVESYHVPSGPSGGRPTVRYRPAA